jgi:hypothetical protein
VLNEAIGAHAEAIDVPRFRLYVRSGQMSRGASLTDLFRRSAGCVAKLLHAAKPADQPFEPLIKFELVINLNSQGARHHTEARPGNRVLSGSAWCHARYQNEREQPISEAKAKVCIGAIAPDAMARPERPLWVDLSRSMVFARTAGSGASRPFRRILATVSLLNT